MFDISKALLAKLPEADAKNAAGHVDEMLQPLTCWQKYLQPSKGETEESSNRITEEDDEEMPQELVQATALESLKLGFSVGVLGLWGLGFGGLGL